MIVPNPSKEILSWLPSSTSDEAASILMEYELKHTRAHEYIKTGVQKSEQVVGSVMKEAEGKYIYSHTELSAVLRCVFTLCHFIIILHNISELNTAFFPQLYSFASHGYSYFWQIEEFKLMENKVVLLNLFSLWPLTVKAVSCWGFLSCFRCL